MPLMRLEPKSFRRQDTPGPLGLRPVGIDLFIDDEKGSLSTHSVSVLMLIGGINLTFWDEMAHIASQHVEKGQQIYVSGRLVSDTVNSDDGKQQTYYKVVVSQLNFVERSAPSAPSYDGDFNSGYNSNSSSMTTGIKQNKYAATGSMEELWQAFFANPVDWWDNRKNKKSPKHPDFKHKDTGEALWVEGRYNPTWVKSQLSVLDSRMESFRDQKANTRSDSMFGDLTSY
nr:protein OSB2, chloroplastic-like [Tanacetum cinerariifolium]GEZ11585.1 protein OSB2, chloroplastic-like [Tanacetum cinerariifolium]